MNAIFENKYIRTKKFAIEIFWCFYFRKTIKYYILLGVIFLFDVHVSFCGRRLNFYLIIIVMIYFVLQVGVYFISVHTFSKRENEIKQGDSLQVSTIVTNESIKTKVSTGAAYEVQWSLIKDVASTRNLVLMRTRANLIYIIKKDAFSRGSYEEFIKFLNSKGFKI